MFINYVSIRVIIFIIILIAIILYFKYKKKENNEQINKINIRKVVIILIIVYLLLYIPFDRIFFSYKKLDDAFKYVYPHGEVVFKKEINNTAFVLGTGLKDKDTPNVFTFSRKKGKKWQVVQSEIESSINNGALVGRNWLYLLYDKKNKAYCVFIEPNKINETDNEYPIVTDSNKKEFERIDIDQRKYFKDVNIQGIEWMYDRTIFYVIYEKELTDDYYVVVGDDKIYIKDIFSRPFFLR